MIFSKLFRYSQMFADLKTKFIDYKEGGPENLFLNQRPLAIPSGCELMRVKAVGINRAECMHRMGKYPIKNQIEKNIGLEASGEVIDPATGEKKFDGIALLSGGSYAQWAVVPKTHIMPLPKGLNHIEGAGIPEAWLTAFQLLGLAELQPGEKVVLYAAASGVGTAAIQICQILGYEAYAVVSTPEKGEVCKKLGAKAVVYYRDNEKWADELIEANGGNSFHAVLDCVAANNVLSTLKLLTIDGRWVLYGGLSGLQTQLNLGLLLAKRIKLISTTLKTRSKQYKDNLIKNFSQQILSEFETKKVSPIISETLNCNWESAEAFIRAHKIMESNQNTGKIIINYQE